jgi:tetratricopeptide (TPR) repeat protein
MEWAFCPTGDPVLGIDLTIAAAPMLMHLSMSNENRRHVDRALAIAMTHQKVDVRREMELYAARGLTLVSTISSGHEVRAAFSRALEIAEQINDADYRLRALWSLCNATFNDGNYGAALDIARRFCAFAAASGDPSALEPGEVLLGVSLHLTGRLGEGRSRLERLLATEYPVDRPSLGRFLLNRRALALSVLAAVLWHLGFPDQAKQRAEEGRLINAQDGAVLLVGHSYGGAVITEAGNNPKVAGMVYVAAFAPEVFRMGVATPAEND